MGRTLTTRSVILWGEQGMMGNVLGAHTLYTSLRRDRSHTALNRSQ